MRPHVRSGWAGHPLSGIVTAGLDQKERRKQPISNFVVAGSGCHWKRNRRERAKGKPELLERFAAGLECGLRIFLHVSRVAGSQRWMGRFGTNGSRIRLAGILTEFSTAPVALYDRRGSRHDRCIRPISFLLIRAHLSKWKTQVWSHAAVHIPPKSHQPCPCGIFVPAAQIHNFGLKSTLKNVQTHQNENAMEFTPPDGLQRWNFQLTRLLEDVSASISKKHFGTEL